MDGEEVEGRAMYAHSRGDAPHAHAARIQMEDEDRAIYTPATRMHSAPLHIPQPPPSLAEQLKQVSVRYFKRHD